MNRRLFTASASLCALFASAGVSCAPAERASQQTQPSVAGKIEAYLEDLEAAGFNGSVLVASENRVLLSRGYGYRDIAAKAQNTPDTLFDIGSLTKQFTGAAIVKLAAEGRLSLNDPIGVYLPGLSKEKRSITIHQLLRHRSGLPGNVGTDYEAITKEEFLSRIDSSTLEFEPGAQFSYSNAGYSLLGMIIEKAAGAAYEDHLRQSLFVPAKMLSTGYVVASGDEERVAIGYSGEEVWGRPTDKAWDGAAPYWNLKANGGILSTTEDLYRWSQALKSNAVLTPESYSKYVSPPLQPDEDPNSYYAYGWAVDRTSRGTRAIWHNGANDAFYAEVTQYPDENVVVISLSNASHPNFRYINEYAANFIFKSDYEAPRPAADTPENRQLTAELVEAVKNDGLERALAAYATRKDGLNVIEFMVADAAFGALDSGDMDLAISLFTLNTIAHPVSDIAWADLGEASLEAGRADEAKRCFSKSLGLNPENNRARNMLASIEKAE